MRHSEPQKAMFIPARGLVGEEPPLLIFLFMVLLLDFVNKKKRARFLLPSINTELAHFFTRDFASGDKLSHHCALAHYRKEVFVGCEVHGEGIHHDEK